jgi:hypothetical protein
VNTDTGKVYRTPNDIAQAEKRGEHVVPVSERVADMADEARAAKLAELNTPCTNAPCTHKMRHHYRGSRRPCKYRGCGCKAFRA